MPGSIGLPLERKCRYGSLDRAGRSDLSDVCGLSRLQCHSVRSDRCAWRGVADRSLARSTPIFQRLHGKDGRLCEELLSRFHAGRCLRQGHRAFGVFQVDRRRRHWRARPGARCIVHCRRLRNSDLWRRVVVRRCVRGLSVRGRDVPAGRYSKAAYPLHDRTRRVQLHDGCLTWNAANSEHHSDDLLQYDDVGRPGAWAHRQRFRFRRWSRLYREPPTRGTEARGRLRHGTSQRAGAIRRAGIAQPWIAIAPLVVVGVTNFMFTYLVPRAYGAKHEVTLGGHAIVTQIGPVAAIWAVEGALLLGILTVFIFAWRPVLAKFADGSKAAVAGALLASLDTASEYGFGGVIALLPGFAAVSAALRAIPNPLVNE